MKYGTLARIPESNDLKAVCDQKFGVLKESGMDSCQLVYKPAVYKLEDADIIRESAEAHGIEISAQFCGYRDSLCVWDNYYDFNNSGLNAPGFRETRLNYLLSAIPFLKRVGTTDMIIHAGFVPNNPFTAEYAVMLSTIQLLGTRLKAAGLNLLFETGPESPISILRLFADTGLDNLYINLDTGNLIMYGYGNPVDAMYTFGKYVRNVHAKDALPPTDPRKLGKETEIGQGFVDFPRVIRMLKEVGYDRFITIEREISGGSQGDEILRAMKYLKELVADC